MRVTISNQWVAEARERVFAHTPAYNADTPMAGRGQALETLRSMVIPKSECRCAIISDLLGAGKSFFLQHAFAEFGCKQGDEPPLVDEQTEYAEFIIDDVVTMSSLEDAHPQARIIVVEELDRKATPSKIQAAVRTVSNWLTRDRLAILTGDFCLRDPALLAEFDKTGGIRRIQLEPLDGGLLLQAIRLRLRHWLQQEPLKLEKEEAVPMADDAVTAMFDPEVLRALLPPTSPPVAAFREVLGLLHGMAEYLPFDTEACRFTADTCRAWLRNSRRPRRWSKDQDEFLRALYHEIRRMSSSEVLEAMDVDRSPWLAQFAKGRVEDYEAEVLEPLVRAGVLLPMGIPYSGQMRKRVEGPYLPTVPTFLDALLGEDDL